MSVETKFISADQNWKEEQTVYWFELTGTYSGTGNEFNGETYGIVESGDESSVVAADGTPLTEGDWETIAVRNSIKITDAIREEAAGL